MIIHLKVNILHEKRCDPLKGFVPIVEINSIRLLLLILIIQPHNKTQTLFKN